MWNSAAVDEEEENDEMNSSSEEEMSTRHSAAGKLWGRGEKGEKSFSHWFSLDLHIFLIHQYVFIGADF